MYAKSYTQYTAVPVNSTGLCWVKRKKDEKYTWIRGAKQKSELYLFR